MRLILGIGNPGNRYKYNRHNVGFLVLDYFAALNSLTFLPSTGNYYFSQGSLEGCKYQLIKPSTFVNNSGLAAKQALDKNKTGLNDFLTIHDDVNLSGSDIRVKVKGGDGGHNGVSSIIYHLNSEEFARIRFGIGNNFEKGGMADYVLSDFSSTEIEQLEKAFRSVSLLMKEFIIGGIDGLLDANSRISNQENKKSENNNM